MSATFSITPQEGFEDNGRTYCLGFVYFPEHVNHDPDGDDLLDENDETVLLSFPVEVYMPIDESARTTEMQAYADDYQSGYWQSVREGHRATQ